jgi:hypothetical protein
MFAHAGKDEKAAHAHNVKAFSTSEWVDPKKATMHEGTFPLLLPKSVLVWVYVYFVYVHP